MYIDGEIRISNELDIIKIIKKIRTHDIALKSSVLNTDERKYHAKFARKYVIDVDSSQSDQEEINSLYQYDDFGPISNADFNGDFKAPSIHDVNINDNFVRHILHPDGKSNFTTVSQFSRPYSAMSISPRGPIIKDMRAKTPTPQESPPHKLD